MTWAPSYTTTVALADYVRGDDTVDDVQLSLAIAAASRAIDRACNRQFGNLAVAEGRYYTAQWDRERQRWHVETDDIADKTGLLVAVDSSNDGTYATSITGVVPVPRNAAQKGKPWTGVEIPRTAGPAIPVRADAVKVTAVWGWAAIPDAIVQATLLQASRLFSRREAPFGVAGSPDVGSEMRLLAKVDPDVEVILGPFRRWWAAC